MFTQDECNCWLNILSGSMSYDNNKKPTGKLVVKFELPLQYQIYAVQSTTTTTTVTRYVLAQIVTTLCIQTMLGHVRSCVQTDNGIISSLYNS